MSMEDVIGEMIANEVGGVIGMVVSRIKYEITLAWGFKKQLEELKEQLNLLGCLLEGAFDEQITNPVMGKWLNNIKDVAYEASIMVDEWSYDVLNKRLNTSANTRTRKRDKLKIIVTYPFSRHHTSHKVVGLKKLIKNIYFHAKELGIKPVQVAAGDVCSSNKDAIEIQKHQRSLHYQRQCVDDELIGRDKDRTQLIQWICDPSNNNTYLTIIGIVGLAGLGKTALSKQVYKATEVSAYFDSLVIWLVVSHSFDIIDCLNGMVEILFKEASNMKVLQALIERLQERLKGKKYLLILDDVWDTTFWEPLRMTLNEIGGSKGSTLLVTSRHVNVVESMRTYRGSNEGKGTLNNPLILRLQGLSECDSWSLFKARINDDVARSENDLLLAGKMMKSCRGVPLAIRALADLLRDKSMAEWKFIEESKVWKQEDKHGILPSLRLSYNYLPSRALKKCFAYCAIFDEDEVIIKDKLIYMWMAHGLLHPYDDEMQHRGEEYCKVLLNSSLFQEAKVDKHGNIKSFKMHDLVLSLARVVSMQECLCSNGGHEDGSIEVRHLSLQGFNKEHIKASSSMKLQTLFYEEEDDDRVVLQLEECRHLKVLKIGKVPNEISMSEMLDSCSKHLRYLELHDIPRMPVLEMRRLQNVKLYHLQTLWIGPNMFDESLLFIKGLVKSDLVNVRHIHCLDPIGIPEGLSRLTALQTLPVIDLQMKWGGGIRELGFLNNLRGTLEIHNVNCISSEEDASSIFLGGDNLKLVENLILVWSKRVSIKFEEDPQQNKILEAMQPHSNLRRLKIKGYGGILFPGWLTERSSPFCNLISLSLKNCPFVKGYLQMENFNYLRFLKISDCNLRLSFPEHGLQCCKLLQVIKVSTTSCLPDLSPLNNLRVLHYYKNGNATKLVGLSGVPCLREVKTNQLLPADLDKQSPLCKSLVVLELHQRSYGFIRGDYTNSLPEQLQYLVALQSLTLRRHSVETIPEWLGNLTALRKLEFEGMKKLKCLPSQEAMKHLFNLKTLSVNHCPIVEEELRSKSREWFKIAHIPNIILDFKRFT